LVDGPVNIGHARRRPKRLAEKLLNIRRALGLSPSEMVMRLGVELPHRNISNYERDKSEPSLTVLLAYARVANVSLEHIADDDVDLEIFKTRLRQPEKDKKRTT
jgi:transcriptional regulator with XRE-family HTH domain